MKKSLLILLLAISAGQSRAKVSLSAENEARLNKLIQNYITTEKEAAATFFAGNIEETEQTRLDTAYENAKSKLEQVKDEMGLSIEEVQQRLYRAHTQ